MRVLSLCFCIIYIIDVFVGFDKVDRKFSQRCRYGVAKCEGRLGLEGI